MNSNLALEQTGKAVQVLNCQSLLQVAFGWSSLAAMIHTLLRENILALSLYGSFD